MGAKRRKKIVAALLTFSIFKLKASFFFCWKDKKISRKKKIVKKLNALLYFLIIGIEKVLLNKVI